MEITKVLIPAAGLGTCFLPYTKTIPKEMLPLLNKPAFQYIAEEVIQSEIFNFLVIAGRNKQSIVDYFEASPILEALLKDRNRVELLAATEKLARLANLTYIHQAEPLGLGHAIWLARNSIHKEYFGVVLPDEIIINKQPALDQLIRIARQEKATVIAVQEVAPELVSSYGIVAIKKHITNNLFQISHVVEKPQLRDAPSKLAIVGRYILPYKIFRSIEQISTDSNVDIQLTSAIDHMVQYGNERVFAYKVQGTRYDIGSPLGWIKAIIGLSLKDPVYEPHIRRFIQEIINSPNHLSKSSNINTKNSCSEL